MNIVSSSQTLVVHHQNKVEQIIVAGDERPTAVVFRSYRTPPHQPWHQDNQGGACLIVFVAELVGKPRPALELPYLIWLQAEHIYETAVEDVRLARLLTNGADLIGGKQGVPSGSCFVRLTDSQEALAIALGIALFVPGRTIFWFVIFGWSGIAATFCPVVILSIVWRRYN